MTHNPTKGVKRPTQPSEKTPILPDDLMARILDAPDENTVKGIRDRAMLSAFAHLALRETELAGLRVGSYGMWDGVMQVKVEGKGDKVRYVEVNPDTQRLLEAYFRWINSAQ
jgi:site-specific recombinase XerC